jgi:hypothetical protein
LAAGEKIPASALRPRLAHLADTVLNDAGHAARHLEAARAAETPEELSFNLRHVMRHLASVTEHGRKLVDALDEYDPAIGAETGKLRDATRDYADPYVTERWDDAGWRSAAMGRRRLCSWRARWTGPGRSGSARLRSGPTVTARRMSSSAGRAAGAGPSS